MEIVMEGAFTLGRGLTFKSQGHDNRSEITNQKREPAGSLFWLVHQFYLFSLFLNFSSIFGTTTL